MPWTAVLFYIMLYCKYLHYKFVCNPNGPLGWFYDTLNPWGGPFINSISKLFSYCCWIEMTNRSHQELFFQDCLQFFFFPYKTHKNTVKIAQNQNPYNITARYPSPHLNLFGIPPLPSVPRSKCAMNPWNLWVLEGVGLTDWTRAMWFGPGVYLYKYNSLYTYLIIFT